MRVGAYTLVEALEGHDRDVHRARDEDGKDVVIAMLELSEAAAAQLHLDWARSRALDHEGIAGALELFEHEGRLVCVLEGVGGVSLSQVFDHLSQQGEQLSDGAALKIGLCIARALHVAHTAKNDASKVAPLVHAQLGPHQVFLTFAGGVRLLGLGLGIAFRTAAAVHDLPEDAKAYSAPETRSGGALTVRANVYSLGALLWRLLSHRGTIDGGELEPLSKLRPDLPAPLTRIIQRALETSMIKRTVSAFQIAEAIDRTGIADGKDLSWNLELLAESDDFGSSTIGALSFPPVHLSDIPPQSVQPLSDAPPDSDMPTRVMAADKILEEARRYGASVGTLSKPPPETKDEGLDWALDAETLAPPRATDKTSRPRQDTAPSEGVAAKKAKLAPTAKKTQVKYAPRAAARDKPAVHAAKPAATKPKTAAKSKAGPKAGAGPKTGAEPKAGAEPKTPEPKAPAKSGDASPLSLEPPTLRAATKSYLDVAPMPSETPEIRANRERIEQAARTIPDPTAESGATKDAGGGAVRSNTSSSGGEAPKRGRKGPGKPVVAAKPADAEALVKTARMPTTQPRGHRPRPQPRMMPGPMVGYIPQKGIVITPMQSLFAAAITGLLCGVFFLVGMAAGRRGSPPEPLPPSHSAAAPTALPAPAPTTEPATTTAPSTSAEAPLPSPATTPPLEASTQAPDPALNPGQALLVVNSTLAGAHVYVAGRHAGKANTPLIVRCGVKNVRLGRVPLSAWLSAGRIVNLRCKQKTTLRL
jgi:eukaryotic-like serine/threonine-protein kinase